MATALAYEVCNSVGALKAFLANLPDTIEIKTVFDKQVCFYLFEEQRHGATTKNTWLGVREE